MDENSASEHSDWPSAVPAGDGKPQPGDIVIDPQLDIAPEPLVGDGSANALEDRGADGPIPENPLLAMKERRHTQWSEALGLASHADLRLAIGDGDATVYAIDDGKHHAVIARVVGSSPSCGYALVGRIGAKELEALVDESLATSEAFVPATELALIGLAQVESVASSNVFDVETYADFDEIPADFRVGAPPLLLAQDLEITAY
jgi:hypothetical protein